MTAKPKRSSGASQTEGWQKAIRKAGKESREGEKARLVRAQQVIAQARFSLSIRRTLRILVQAHDDGALRTGELIEELRRMGGDAPWPPEGDTRV